MTAKPFGTSSQTFCLEMLPQKPAAWSFLHSKPKWLWKAEEVSEKQADEPTARPATLLKVRPMIKTVLEGEKSLDFKLGQVWAGDRTKAVIRSTGYTRRIPGLVCAAVRGMRG